MTNDTCPNYEDEIESEWWEFACSTCGCECCECWMNESMLDMYDEDEDNDTDD